VGIAAVAAAGAGGYLANRLSRPAAESRPIETPGTARASLDRVPAEGLEVAPAPPQAERPPQQKPVGDKAGSASQKSGPAARATLPEPPATRTMEAPSEAKPGDAVGSVSTAATPPPIEPPVEVPPPASTGAAADPLAPAPPRFQELVVKEDTVIGVRLESSHESGTAQVEDRVTARVTRDVVVDGRTAIPSGARLEGVVTSVDVGGRFKTPGRLAVRFTTLVVDDRTRIPIDTDPIFRVGDLPSNQATSRVGASAVVGAILGAVVGGKRGAAIGTAAGAAGGVAAVAAGGRSEATLPAGTLGTVRLVAPVVVLVERDLGR
jgi:hypothetical protein